MSWIRLGRHLIKIDKVLEVLLEVHLGTEDNYMLIYYGNTKSKEIDQKELKPDEIEEFKNRLLSLNVKDKVLFAKLGNKLVNLVHVLHIFFDDNSIEIGYDTIDGGFTSIDKDEIGEDELKNLEYRCNLL